MSPFRVHNLATSTFRIFAIVATIWRLAPSYPLQRHGTDDAVDTPEPFAALSGISRASCVTVMLIQWH